MELNDDAQDPMFGTPYAIRGAERLGRGGMGDVFEALHIPLKKHVVVKLLHAHLVTPSSVERLRIEAQTLAQLAHPNIVVVTDLGTTPGGRPYIVMERLRGHSLALELKHRGPLPVSEAIDITCDLLRALGAAHAAGVVHRDVKAANVFLHVGPSGTRETKLIDFGIAKLMSGAEVGVAPSKFPTETGEFVGSPPFASPEQLRAAAIDARADIYAIGLLLFQLVCGRPAFAKPDLIEVLHAQLHESAPKPSSVANQSIPASLDAITLRALAKNADDRFRSAGEMLDALLKVGAPQSWDKTEEMVRPLVARQRTDLDATLEAPRPLMDEKPTVEFPRPQIVEKATVEVMRPITDDKATVEYPRPEVPTAEVVAEIAPIEVGLNASIGAPSDSNVAENATTSGDTASRKPSFVVMFVLTTVATAGIILLVLRLMGGR